MKVETRKVITLTKAEQKTIHDLYSIFDEDDTIDTLSVWDILTDIYLKDSHGNAEDYGYKIEFVN